MRSLALVLLVGCRLNFDAVDGDGDGGMTTGDGAQTCAAVESCNGIDDTCDAQIDEGCGCTPFDVEITSTGGSQSVSVVWTGARYLIVLLISAVPSQMALYRVEADGDFVLWDALGTGSPGTPVWTGTEMLFPYTDNGSAWIRRFDSDGDAIGTAFEVQGTMASAVPHLARAGDRVGAAWPLDNSDAGEFRELALDGTPLTAVTPVPFRPMSLVRGTNGYLLGTRDSGGGSLARIDDDGTITRTPVNGSFAFISRRATDAALVEDVISAETFRPVTLDGTLGTSMPLPMYGGFSQSNLELAGAESNYRLFGESAANPTQLLRTELDPLGNVLSGPTPFAAPKMVSSTTRLTATITAGRELVVMPYTAGTYVYRLVHTCL